MKKGLLIALVAGAVFAPSGFLGAQAAPATAQPSSISVILSYHEDNSGTFRVMSSNTTEVTGIQDGDPLKPGWTVVTGTGDVAELRLTFTGTIIKISQNTNFTVDGLRTESGGQDLFSLGVGKIRTVAGRASDKDQYQIKTQSAVCGVRGSDIVVEFAEATTSRLYTLEGTGWIQDVKTGQTLDVPQGDFADALAPSFQPAPIPQDVLASLQKEMDFVKLNPADAISQEKEYQQEQAQAQQPAQPAQPSPAPKSGFMDGVFAALHNVLAFEIGTLTIDGQAYGMAVLEPTFTTGKLKMALYLPIIYRSNLLDPGDWYHPGGNDEWSFGTDQGGDPSRVAADISRDLLLKLKYVEYGRPRDPFFLKVGDLEDITIGHGLVMRGFANDADFPSVRRLGVNVGADFGGGGFEAMVSDAVPNIINGTVYPPDLMGARFYVRPVPGYRGALGFSMIADLDPAADYNSLVPSGPTLPPAAGSPYFLFPGADLDLPLMEKDSFGLTFFTDTAFFLPLLRASPTDAPFASLQPGFQQSAVWSPSSAIKLKNWGASAGFLGNLIIRDFTWRLEYRISTGAFVPELYDSSYVRTRNQNVLETLGYLTDPTNPAFNVYKMGIYGEAGFTLSKIFAVRAGYFWPWVADPSTGTWATSESNPDRFVASFELMKGAIPFVNLSGALSYERTNLFYGGNLPTGINDAFFSAYTDFTARVTYSVSPIMDISLFYTITPVFNPDGSLHYTGNNYLPDMATSVSITTSVQL